VQSLLRFSTGTSSARNGEQAAEDNSGIGVEALRNVRQHGRNIRRVTSDIASQNTKSHAGSERPSRESREDYVPFDDPSGLSELLSRESSITENEKKTLMRLRDLASPKVAQEPGPGLQEQAFNKPKPRSSSASALDAILDEALAEMEDDAQDRLPRLREDTNEAVQGLRDSEMARITKHLIKQDTDAGVWKIVMTEIMDPVIALDLDNPTTTDTDASGDKSNTSRKRVSKAKQQAVIGANFPKLLYQAAVVLAEHFPSSLYNQAILPQLRHSGPTTFALGATTELYNLSITYAFEKHQDLPQIADSLDEMERVFIQPNEGTLNILTQVSIWARRVRDGAYGDMAQTVFGMERLKKSLASIEACSTKYRRA